MISIVIGNSSKNSESAEMTDCTADARTRSGALNHQSANYWRQCLWINLFGHMSPCSVISVVVFQFRFQLKFLITRFFSYY